MRATLSNTTKKKILKLSKLKNP